MVYRQLGSPKKISFTSIAIQDGASQPSTSQYHYLHHKRDTANRARGNMDSSMTAAHSFGVGFKLSSRQTLDNTSKLMEEE